MVGEPLIDSHEGIDTPNIDDSLLSLLSNDTNVLSTPNKRMYSLNLVKSLICASALAVASSKFLSPTTTSAASTVVDVGSETSTIG